MAPTLAIVGAGFMGSAHAANYASLGDRVRVKTVVGLSPERAAQVARTVDASSSVDLAAVLGDSEIDAVDICLPTPLHREAAEQAFAAGKDVFLEKPLALTAEDAEAIVAAAARSGSIFMVGLVLRFWPEYVALHRLVERGDLGRPKAVFAQRLSPPADWADWLRDRAQSGGTAVDLMIHDFDQMNALLGTPRSVYASEPEPGHVHALVEYADGGSGIAEGSMAMPRSYPFSSDIRVLGERGVAEYAFSAAPVEGESNIGASSSPRGLRIHPVEAEMHVEEVASADPWGPEIEYFVSCLEQGRQPEQGTGEQALWALKVSLAANRSLASGRPEQV
ncbi:MAG TPA: Gfo/Idh/MocA family oxidoreductase [Gaiellaceae bacterium]